MKKQKYPEELIVKIMADPRSLGILSKEYKIGKSTIGRWKTGKLKSLQHIDLSIVPKTIRKIPDKHHMTKLTPEQVAAIRLDTRRMKEVCQEYNITDTIYCNIKTRKTWRHLEGPINKKYEFSYGSKLLVSQVLAIRKDPRTAREIAKEYNVGTTAIYNIKNRKTWRHLDDNRDSD